MPEPLSLIHIFMECKARGAKVIVVATEGDEEINIARYSVKKQVNFMGQAS